MYTNETILLSDSQFDFYTRNESSPLLEAKIGFVSGILLLVLSLGLTFASVKNIGNVGFLAIMALVFVIGMRRPTDMVLAWLTTFYNPELLAGASLPNMKITIVISFFVCLIYGRLSLGRLVNRATIGFVCFLAWLLLTVAITPDKSDAARMYGLLTRNLIIMGLLFCLVTDEQELGRVLKWWAIVAALSFIPVFVHYILGPNTWLYYAYEVTRKQVVERGSVDVAGDSVGRLVWAGNDPNGRGTTLLFPFAIALAYLMCSKAKDKVFWAAVLGVIAICILGTFSRSSFISLCFILTLFAIVMNIRAIVPIFFAYFIGILTISFIPAIQGRIFSIQESVSASGGSGRLDYWKQALNYWAESPIFGHGLRSFWMFTSNETHNSYLELAADTGTIGVLLFCGLMGMACLWAFGSTKNRVEIKAVFGKTIGCGMIGLCVMIGTITYTSKMDLWMAFAACFLLYHFRWQYTDTCMSLPTEEENSF